MGDGIEPLIRGVVGTVAAGIAGLAHGAMDSSLEMNQLEHTLLSYMPAVGAGAYVASSKYGLWNRKAKINGFFVGAGLAAAASAAAYVGGRAVSAAYYKLTI